MRVSTQLFFVGPGREFEIWVEVVVPFKEGARAPELAPEKKKHNGDVALVAKSTVTHVIRISACRVFGVLQIFLRVPGHDRSSLKNQQLNKIPTLRVTRGFREIGPVQAKTSELPTASERNFRGF